MKTICISLALTFLALPVRAEIKRWPKVMDLTIGMKLADARAALAAHKTPFRERDDDKPVRHRSSKIKAKYPAGARAKKVTLYFLDKRLWQIKLRPGEKLCKELGRSLGKPDGKRGEIVAWANRSKLQGAFCSKDAAFLMDWGALVRAGVDRSRIERDFKRFVGGLIQK